MKRIITISIICALASLTYAQNENFGIDEPNPSQKLDVAGWIEIGNETTGTTGTAGAIRYNSSGKVQFHDGTQWVDIFSANNPDGDGNSSNELIFSITLVGSTLQIVDAAGSHNVNVSSLINDADANPSNELQTISKSGSTVTLSNGGGSYTDAVEDGDWATSGSNIVNSNSGNVGIGTASPSAKLHVNGTVKTNVVQYPDGSTQTRATRVIHTADTRGGCPGSWAANTDMIVQTFTLSSPAAVSIHCSMIRNMAGRGDLVLYVNGSFLDQTLTYTSAGTWVDAHVQWVGVLAAGTYTVSVRSPQASVWGCGPSWGAIDTEIFE